MFPQVCTFHKLHHFESFGKPLSDGDEQSLRRKCSFENKPGLSHEDNGLSCRVLRTGRGSLGHASTCCFSPLLVRPLFRGQVRRQPCYNCAHLKWFPWCRCRLPPPHSAAPWPWRGCVVNLFLFRPALGLLTHTVPRASAPAFPTSPISLTNCSSHLLLGTHVFVLSPLM